MGAGRWSLKMEDAKLETVKSENQRLLRYRTTDLIWVSGQCYGASCTIFSKNTNFEEHQIKGQPVDLSKLMKRSMMPVVKGLLIVPF